LRIPALFQINIVVVRQFKIPEWLPLVILTALAFALRCYVASLDPYLHKWDERFHALVARNMMDNPFVPMLRKGQMLPYDYRNWVGNTVWLHKQPLFLWQMALSMKLFGVSIFALRVPNIIMGTLMVPMLYHICRQMGCNHFTAITAAALHCFSFYHLELVSGNAGMDHNDVAFSFYILASIWAYAFYARKKTWRWVILIGVFAGCAILCKWLAGLLVYAGWGIAMLYHIREKDFWKRGLHFLFSLIVTAIVVLPWQLYILWRFPAEAQYEYGYSARHLSEAVENHRGAWDYYFAFFPQYFGDTICWLVPAGIVLLLFAKELNRHIRIAVVSMLVLAIVFFSFAAKTKILAYLMPVVPLGFIAIAFCTDKILRLANSIAALRVSLSVMVFLLYCNLSLQWGELQSSHNPNAPERQAIIANTAIYRHLKAYLKPGTKVVMNLPDWEDIDVMFFNNDLIAHGGCPGPSDFQIYVRHSVGIAVFPDHNSAIRNYRPCIVPDYVLHYEKAYLLPVKGPAGGAL
jgi:4-amino-4-deoxy-L-arabinose transferase